ncbi:hypothetical protein [Paenibacillus sp. QZ-Y1]|uniref:hypothetical protein n=1 Tax=Paenibacillus sp. QZ-Y1 TaxID=3414511 RepID=UPI003F7ABA04
MPNESATYDGLTAKQITDYTKRFDELGVKEEKRAGLLDKLSKGEPLDSDQVLFRAQGEIESDVTKSTYVNSEGKTVESTVEEFPDGSITTYVLTHDQVTCGTGYCNYKKTKVSGGSITSSAYFYVDFTLVNGGMDYVSAKYDYNIQVVAGSYDSENLTTVKATESLSGPAKVSLRWKYSGGGLTTTQYLHFYVGNDTPSSEFVK